MNLFDMMRAAGGGQAFESLGRQYGLSPDQVARAVEAFLPAFSTGLKRSAADPLSFFEVMRRFGAGKYAGYYNNPGRPAGRTDGEDALNLLFGSDEVIRAIAEQASRFTGIAEAKLRDMLPALAATLFGGLQQQSAAGNPALAAMFRHFSGAGLDQTAADPPRPAGAKGPLDRYEEEQEAKAREEAASNPFAHLQAEGMRSAMSAVTAGATTWADMMAKLAGAPDTAAPGAQPKAAPDIFGDMFEPGLRLTEAYERNIQAILERGKS